MTRTTELAFLYLDDNNVNFKDILSLILSLWVLTIYDMISVLINLISCRRFYSVASLTILVFVDEGNNLARLPTRPQKTLVGVISF